MSNLSCIVAEVQEKVPETQVKVYDGEGLDKGSILALLPALNFLTV